MHDRIRIGYFDALKANIEGPPRSNWPGVVIILLEVVILSLLMIFPMEISLWALLGFILITPLAIALRQTYAIHLALFCLLWILLSGLFSCLRIWPFYLILPLMVYGIITATVPFLRRSVTWLRTGHLGGHIPLLMIITIVLSAIGLIIWYFIASPDIHHHLALIPKMPVWLFPVTALLFAFLNAAMEETIFRGIMMEALDSALGAGHFSIILQSLSFAALHYRFGFPNRFCGFWMVFVYGWMLGFIRRKSRGILAPWIVHVVADITIFIILAVALFTEQRVGG